MKNFIRKTVLFLLLSAVVIESVSTVLLLTKLYLINYPGNAIYLSIEKSKKKNKSKIVLLGDSVGRQIFSNKTNNDTINSLACNQAIGIVGQYLLLNNYLRAGNKIDKVVMLFTPFSFSKNLDQVYTYRYFLKPFDNSDYNPLFTSAVKKQINKIPFRRFDQVPHIRITSWAPELNSTEKKKYSFLSPISKEYLAKIKQLSIQYNFKLNILPTPTNIEKKKSIDAMNLDGIAEGDFNNEFKNYFTNIVYLDSTEFVDGTHLIHPEKYAIIIRKKILE